MEKYYPKNINPIHEIQSWCKVRSIIRAVRRGASMPSIIIDGEIGNGNLIAGTHRAAANDLMDMLGDSSDNRIEWVSLEDYLSGIDTSTASVLMDAISDNDFAAVDCIVNTK